MTFSSHRYHLPSASSSQPLGLGHQTSINTAYFNITIANVIDSIIIFSSQRSFALSVSFIFLSFVFCFNYFCYFMTFNFLMFITFLFAFSCFLISPHVFLLVSLFLYLTFLYLKYMYYYMYYYIIICIIILLYVLLCDFYNFFITCLSNKTCFII